MNIFVDASVIIAASLSKSGGSALVLRLARVGKLQLMTSESVIEEVMRNVSKIHLSWEKIAELIVASKMHIVEAPNKILTEKLAKIASRKDAHVLAAAVEAKAKIVITLDKKHLLQERVKKSLKNILAVMTPGELLKKLVE